MALHLLLGVAVVGFTHGLEPGHGWPLSVVYSLGRRNPYLHGIISSLIISGFHFLSTIVVVGAFLILHSFIPFPEDLLGYVAAATLIILGIYIFRKHEHHEEEYEAVSLRQIAYLAFIIGFAHEEEFMLISLILTGVDPLILVLVYSLAVTASITGVTLLGIKTYEYVKERVEDIEHIIGKIAGGSMVLMGLSILIQTFLHI